MATPSSDVTERQIDVFNNDEELGKKETKSSMLLFDEEEEAGKLKSPELQEVSEFEDNSKVPKLSLWACFWLFLKFGMLAWGGPVVQIQMIKERLVIEEEWITINRFNRVFSVYQILPGPEAAELCMFFGYLARGAIGGIIGGIGFMLPGFILMLVFSYVYTIVSVNNVYFNASFRALQPIVSALVLRAAIKIAEHAFLSHRTHKFEKWLFFLAILSAFQSALRINLFITLGVLGLVYTAIDRRMFILAAIILLVQYAAFAVYVVFKGMPSPFALGIGVASTPDPPHLLALGLVAGSLSFGGAYTTIPFVQAEAVYMGGWLTRQTFLDGIALGNILPAPLVIFNTFVGFQGGYVYGGISYGFIGAVLMTIGVFFPCFLFTIMGHQMLEKLVRNKTLAGFFEGITGAVVGIIAMTALDMLKVSVGSAGSKSTGAAIVTAVTAARPGDNAIAAVLYMLTLAGVYSFKHPQMSIILVVIGAIAGQLLFGPET